MNERIREISLAAGGSHYPSINPELQQRFAELIVQECVRYLNEDYQRDFDSLWREDLSKGIKKHFGVKE
jgi:hypothetical protein